MFAKTFIVCALLAVAQGGLLAGHGAISSQSIVLGHPAPAIAAHAVAAPALGWGLGHGGLVSHGSLLRAPLIHAAPVAHAVAPVEVYVKSWKIKFNAVVSRQGHAAHPATAAVAHAPVAIASLGHGSLLH
ncbi:putative cuticle protein CPR150 [Danaus plexippus plexippus]|uniref:Cuticle protein CPR150 n=1 Tax=Danaus plexippus plexippus TaxID=278856 RepID=A0A212F8Z0_DANPL|nr:putative cuticle protein CPR150 [Danaus plexippus plexippus]